MFFCGINLRQNWKAGDRQSAAWRLCTGHTPTELTVLDEVKNFLKLAQSTHAKKPVPGRLRASGIVAALLALWSSFSTVLTPAKNQFVDLALVC